ncbi:MAG TPA: ATP-binding protein, partial [Ilumatobacter sp.]|nr:ATP-binding protein [Ilumatobacter sp.]
MPDAPPPLHGRDEIVQQACRVFERGGAGVMLVGPPGIGKSRLAVEIVGQIDPDAAVVRINGSPASVDVPLGAFAPLLPGGMAELALPAILHVRRSLQERSGGAAVVLAVEDAHLLDEASAALVLQFATGGDVRLVATQRSAVATPDAIV